MIRAYLTPLIDPHGDVCFRGGFLYFPHILIRPGGKPAARECTAVRRENNICYNTIIASVHSVIAESAVVETDDGQVDAQEYDTDLTEEGSDTQSPDANPAAEDPGVQEDPEEGLDIAVPEQAEDADEQEISEVTAEEEGSEAISEETEAANERATEGATEEYTAPEEELIQTDETIMAEESNEALKENAPAVGGAQAIWTADNATLTFLDSSENFSCI